MYCPKCGREIADNLSSCPFCGQQFGEAENVNANPTANGWNAPEQNIYNGYTAPASKPNGGTGALVCGILSIVLAFPKLILSIIGLVLAGKAKKENGGVMPGKARAGQICSIITLVFIIIGIILFCLFIGKVVTAAVDAMEEIGYEKRVQVLEASHTAGLIDDDEYAVEFAALEEELSNKIAEKLCEMLGLDPSILEESGYEYDYSYDYDEMFEG